MYHIMTWLNFSSQQKLQINKVPLAIQISQQELQFPWPPNTRSSVKTFYIYNITYNWAYELEPGIANKRE